MNNKFSLGALIVVAVIAISSLYISSVNKNTITVVREEAKPVVGSVAGPDSFYEEYNFNGVRKAYRASALKTGTTTVCSLRAPTHATSSLSFGSVIVSASSTQQTVYLAKSDAPFATTTSLQTQIFAANRGGHIVASSSPTVFGTNVFDPGQYLVVSIATAGVGAQQTNSSLGLCSAEFNLL